MGFDNHAMIKNETEKFEDSEISDPMNEGTDDKDDTETKN